MQFDLRGMVSEGCITVLNDTVAGAINAHWGPSPGVTLVESPACALDSAVIAVATTRHRISRPTPGFESENVGNNMVGTTDQKYFLILSRRRYVVLPKNGDCVRLFRIRIAATLVLLYTLLSRARKFHYGSKEAPLKLKPC